MRTEDSLLSAVLDEDADTRAATLAQVRTLARRKRAARAGWRLGAAVAVLLAGVVAFWPRRDFAPPSEEGALRIVRSKVTVPEVRSEVGGFASVRTQRMAFAALEPAPEVRIFRTWEAPAAFETLSDRELLAFFPGRVMLVSPGTPDARLIVY